MDDGTLREVARRLREAWKTTVLTGAGLSAASGVPTFRGADGLWRTHQAEDLASVQGFRADPQLVWEFTLERKRVIAACAPNRAHEVLAAWSRTLPSFTVLTQNVDGLHDRAGTVSVIELHGSIWEVGCALQCVDSPRRMLVIGTTAVVEPAASFIELAKSPSTLVVEINPEPSRKAAWLMDVVLAAPAVEVLERLDSELRLTDSA